MEIDDIYQDPNHGLNGPVYCPDTGYFDPVLNRKFETKREKREYMRAHGLMMHSGSKPQTEGKGEPKIFSYSGIDRCSRSYKYR